MLAYVTRRTFCNVDWKRGCAEVQRDREKERKAAKFEEKQERARESKREQQIARESKRDSEQ